MKRFILLIILICLLIIVSLFGYRAYIEINCSGAKQYLIDEYNFNKNDLKSDNYIEYVYEDIADCNSLWLKKCTNDKDLLYNYFFTTKDGTQIIVSENKDGLYSDDYQK